MSSKRKKKTRINKKKVLFTVFLFALVIGVPSYFLLNGNKAKAQQEKKEPTKEEKKAEKKLQIVDPNSKSRPIAVMINNNHEAWPHAGLQDAYLVYEIVTEGGITRMMAVFKDRDTAKIGSVRSARHYFLDYALENDAVYAHYGWSPQAIEDIDKLNVANINGLSDKAFWRDTSLHKAYEHTAFTSIEKLKESAKRLNYREETNRDLLLNYSIDEVPVSEEAIDARNIEIPYSNYHTTSYEYDENAKVYKRSMSGTKHVDAVTGKQYTAKNIIVIQVENYAIDSYGRQDISNIGSGEGYYITNGKATPIKWKKTSRSAQTVYTYKNGKEITVNDGNTFIQIQPKNQKLSVS